MRGRLLLIALCLNMLQIIGCRGYTSPDPPMHVNPNMDIQEKGKAYKQNDLFADGQYMRPRIAGTISRGDMKSDSFYVPTNNMSLPKDLDIDEAFMKRGQRLFNRTCAACHGMVGDGDGLVGRRLMVRPTSLHSEYMYGLPPGHFAQVIQNGIRTMQPYGYMISEHDIWAIVTYIRALQMSQDINGDWIKRSASLWKQ
jgi:mono/diheme cytochrome c family protein